MKVDWMEAIREKRKVVQNVLKTPEGKKLFAVLEDTFERKPLKGENPHETYYNLGQRDLVQYLRELRDFTNE